MEFMNLAHRGASAYAPENTLAAFYMGVEMGANGIETDLQKTKDGVIFLFHDDKIDNKTNGKGYPEEHTWAELEQLDAGSWLSPKYKGERLITFTEFLHFFGRKDLLFAIELKARFTTDEIKKILKMIDSYDMKDRVTITSFIFDNLTDTRRMDKNIAIGYLLWEFDAGNIKQLKEIDAQQICPYAEILTPENVALAKESGLVVRAWGVKNTELMQHGLDCGVDGMTLNFPDKLPK
ncbi:glycerophosphodiester phosphodiesterase [Chloroflexota bacterium]